MSNKPYTPVTPAYRQATLIAIVACLDGGTVTKQPKEEEYHWQGWINADITGGQLSLHYNDDRKGDRITIIGSWPKDDRGEEQCPDWDHRGHPSISVSAEKSPEAIAKDIKRRLLADYLPLFAVALAKAERSNAYDASVRANYHALALAAGAQVTDHWNHKGKLTLRFLPEGVSIKDQDVTATEVTVALRLSIREACAVLRTQRAGTDAALLDALKTGDGAALYWQLPAPWDNYERIEQAVERGVLLLDPDNADLVVHPKATRFTDIAGGVGYTLDPPDDDQLSECEKGSHIDPNDIINSRGQQ